ncbi:MAG: methyltransferase [Planctomycetaceae bacterium]|nr:methyltransferase [Planctomycetaceae bacterium]
MPVDLLSQWSDRSALIHHLNAHFPVAHDSILVRDLQLDVFSVANPHDQIDRLMGRVVDGDFQWEPFWAQAWPSARELAHWMTAPEKRQQWSGRSVLDLGCGVGLCGCVAAAMGSTVTLADYAEPAIWFAAANAWPWREHAEAIVLDWHLDQLPTKYDCILGADIVYEQRNWSALANFFSNQITDSGQIILTEPGRDTGETFQDYLRPLGWSVTSSVLTTLTNGRPLRLIVATRAPTQT